MGRPKDKAKIVKVPLSEVDIRMIRTMREYRFKVSEISLRFGISRDRVLKLIALGKE